MYSEPKQPRESFAFPTPGNSIGVPYDELSAGHAREARLSQFNVQQLQRQIEEQHDGRWVGCGEKRICSCIGFLVIP